MSNSMALKIHKYCNVYILFQSEKCSIGLQSFVIVFVGTRTPILSKLPKSQLELQVLEMYSVPCKTAKPLIYILYNIFIYTFIHFLYTFHTLSYAFHILSYARIQTLPYAFPPKLKLPWSKKQNVPSNTSLAKDTLKSMSGSKLTLSKLKWRYHG